MNKILKHLRYMKVNLHGTTTGGEEEMTIDRDDESDNDTGIYTELMTY